MTNPETSAGQGIADALGIHHTQAADTAPGFQERLVAFINDFTAHWSWQDLMFQVLIVAVSVLVGYWLSARIRTACRKALPPAADQHLGAYFKRLLLTFVSNVSFSFVSGCVLAMGAYFLLNVMGYPSNSMVLLRIAYSVFFAYALLCLCLGGLQVILGEHVITPALKKTFVIGFWILAALEIVGILGDLIEYLDHAVIPIGGGNMTVWTLILAVITVIITLGIANWLSKLVHRFVFGIESLSTNIKVALNRVITITFIILGVIIALSSVGINLTVLSVFGGAVGVGLGFGLQKIASNYISGFIILLDKSIKIGDLVTVADFRGRVTEINTRFTVVRNNTGTENIVPNEYFVTSAVQNHSYTDESTVQNLTIGVSYSADVRRALEIMVEEANRERPRIDTSRRGWSYIDDFADSSINLTLGFWVKDPANGTAGLKTQIALDCMERFAKEGIEIPFPQLDLNVRHVDAGEIPVRVRMDAAKDKKEA